MKINLALSTAEKRFQTKDLFLMCQYSGCELVKGSIISIKFFNTDFLVTKEGKVQNPGENVLVPGHLRLLLLHYLISSNGQEQSGKLVPFRGLPNARSYEEAFMKRAVNPISGIFSNDPSKFREAAENLGGVESGYGDLSYTIPVLPRIPLTYVLWLGEGALPAGANILFDISASKHLHTEDLAVLGETTTHLLQKGGNLTQEL